MSERKVNIREIGIEWDDLISLSNEEKTLYAGFCFLVSELNALQRLVLFSLKLFPDESVLEAAARIQSNTLIRIYSSKAYEALEFLRSASEKSKSSEIKRFCKTRLESLGDFKGMKGHSVTFHVRMKMAFHLDYGQIRKSLESIRKVPNCSIYIGENDGNSFFPIGEHIIQESGLSDVSSDSSFGVISEDDHAAWVDWTIAAHSKIKEVLLDIFEVFIQPKMQKCLPVPIDHTFEGLVVGRNQIDFLPLFYTGAK